MEKAAKWIGKQIFIIIWISMTQMTDEDNGESESESESEKKEVSKNSNSNLTTTTQGFTSKVRDFEDVAKLAREGTSKDTKKIPYHPTSITHQGQTYYKGRCYEVKVNSTDDNFCSTVGILRFLPEKPNNYATYEGVYSLNYLKTHYLVWETAM